MLVFLTSCTQKNGDSKEKKVRLIKNTDISSGESLFIKNCVVCHGKKAIGTNKNWKIAINKVYPPPPLNGTAHAWHHSPKLLLSIIKEGGAKNGGAMPSFNNLSLQNRKDILAYLYSLWPEDIQNKYADRYNYR